MSHSRSPLSNLSDDELAEDESEEDEGEDGDEAEDCLYEEQVEEEVEEMAGEIDFVKKVMAEDNDDAKDRSIVESEASFMEQDERRVKGDKKGKERKKGEPWSNIVFFRSKIRISGSIVQ